jgi:hypothetical protein
MEPHALSQLFLLYSWFTLAALCLFYTTIARFYQQFSGRATHYRRFILVAALYGAGWVRYAAVDQTQGDAAADLALGLAGAAFAFAAVALYRQMTRPHAQEDGALAAAFPFAFGLFAFMGSFGLMTACVVLGLLSGRLGHASGAQPFHRCFYAAAVLLFVRAALRGSVLFLGWSSPEAVAADPAWIVLTDGLLATALTLAVVIAWRYWSWLLAERA